MYNPAVPTETADRAFTSGPLSISREMTQTMLNSQAAQEPARFDALERAGFKVERYGSIIYHIYERLGGHYMDVGASAKIAHGLIKVKSDSLPVQYLQNGLQFADGSVLEANVIVFATGFENDMSQAVGRILGDHVVERLRPFWTLNAEGELTGECTESGRKYFHVQCLKT
jgi:hypothetical protein